jgi:hypothetical protein
MKAFFTNPNKGDDKKEEVNYEGTLPEVVKGYPQINMAMEDA